MSSVDDIRLKENYIVLDSWDVCHRPVLKVYPERRDWTRQNFEMDLRYVESVLYVAIKSMRQNVEQFVVECDCRGVSLWHIKPKFIKSMALNIRKKFKNRLYEVRLINTLLNLPLWLALWMAGDSLPASLKGKVKYS